MESLNILIVEDDPNLGQILKEYLQLKGHKTTLCRDGEEGLASYQEGEFGFCILDVMMPKKDGFTLAREIRDVDKQIPIIFLTAKSMKEDTIQGLKIGADDYLTKPFSMEELLLRISAINKRINHAGPAKSALPGKVELGKFIFYYDRSMLEGPSGEVKLTSRENELLRLFVENINQNLDRSYALKSIWKDDSYFNARSMDVYIAKLRKHLKADESVQILTVHGQGFKLVKIE
ncbi:MAG: response regulator transcription factor [Cyclobacteriaceae bacterium]